MSTTSARHIKTGNIYEVHGIAINATNGQQEGEAMVVYTRNDVFFVRRLDEFLEKFETL